MMNADQMMEQMMEMEPLQKEDFINQIVLDKSKENAVVVNVTWHGDKRIYVASCSVYDDSFVVDDNSFDGVVWKMKSMIGEVCDAEYGQYSIPDLLFKTERFEDGRL